MTSDIILYYYIFILCHLLCWFALFIFAAYICYTFANFCTLFLKSTSSSSSLLSLYLYCIHVYIFNWFLTEFWSQTLHQRLILPICWMSLHFWHSSRNLRQPAELRRISLQVILPLPKGLVMTTSSFTMPSATRHKHTVYNMSVSKSQLCVNFLFMVWN